MRTMLGLVLSMVIVPLAATSARAEPAADPVIHMISYIEVAPTPAAARNQTVMLLRALATASRREEGNLRFEVLQRTAPASQFVILEAWKDQAALDAHNAADHTKTFKERLAPHLIAPVDERHRTAANVAPPSHARTNSAFCVVSH